MNRLHFTEIAILLLVTVLVRPVRAGQQETCTMDDKTHLAKYSCPDGYEVVYAGEGTKVCNGACYRKGSSQSMKMSVGRLVENRWGREYLPGSEELSKTSGDLLTFGKASITNPKKGTLELKAPKE
jgi:hypothetical protein